jgi:uncharacterized membrane protein YjgN (DUF898 family)
MHAMCHYTLLGIATDAGLEEIQAAYAKAISRFKRRLSEGKPLPVEHLDALRTAYQVLAHPAHRAAYDRIRTEAPRLPSAIIDTGKVAAVTASPATFSTESTFEFRGKGDEYLRIWLVNIALSLLTLGIYSAWAKVRREKYFHRNFVLDGATFDYHGNPKAILKGRVLMVALFALVSLAEHLGSAVHAAASLCSLLVFPWLLVRSMRFRAHNTSYRGIRFTFSGSYRQALSLYLLHGGLSVLTLGLYFPAFLYRQKRFVANHLCFGDKPCRFEAGAKVFYRGLALPLILWLLFAGAAVVGAYGIVAKAGLIGGAMMLGLALLSWGALLSVGIVLFFLLILLPYTRVVGTNLLWNHTHSGAIRFHSTQKVSRYLAIVFSNWMLTLLTLGFFWPLAQIRLAHFRARNLTVVGANQLDEILANRGDDPEAFGGETMDALDLDIAL